MEVIYTYPTSRRIAPRYIALAVGIILCGIYFAYGNDAKTPLQMCQEAYIEKLSIVELQNQELMKSCKKHAQDIFSLQKCSEGALEIPKNTCGSTSLSATGGKAPEPPKSRKGECAIGTGSHDLRPMAKYHPGVAGWKNNNTSGLTVGSKKLQNAFDEAGISWGVGTARPSNEGSHYYNFPDIENGLKAKILIIRRSYMNSTISAFLRVWGTDNISTTLDRRRTIGSLNDGELLSLIRSQIQKESGKAMSHYIFDPKNKIIVCE